MPVKLGIFPNFRGQNKQLLKPPPSDTCIAICFQLIFEKTSSSVHLKPIQLGETNLKSHWFFPDLGSSIFGRAWDECPPHHHTKRRLKQLSWFQNPFFTVLLIATVIESKNHDNPVLMSGHISPFLHPKLVKITVVADPFYWITHWIWVADCWWLSS